MRVTPFIVAAAVAASSVNAVPIAKRGAPEGIEKAHPEKPSKPAEWKKWDDKSEKAGPLDLVDDLVKPKPRPKGEFKQDDKHLNQISHDKVHVNRCKEDPKHITKITHDKEHVNRWKEDSKHITRITHDKEHVNRWKEDPKHITKITHDKEHVVKPSKGKPVEEKPVKADKKPAEDEDDDEDEWDIDNHATFIPIQGTAALLSGVSNAISTRGIDNSASFIPVQLTGALASGVKNGVHTARRGADSDGIDNASSFVPIQLTGALASVVGNSVKTTRRQIENSSTFIPIQGTLAAFSEVTNVITTGDDHEHPEHPEHHGRPERPEHGREEHGREKPAHGPVRRQIENSSTFIPIQGTLAAFSEVTNVITTGDDHEHPGRSKKEPAHGPKVDKRGEGKPEGKPQAKVHGKPEGKPEHGPIEEVETVLVKSAKAPWGRGDFKREHDALEKVWERCHHEPKSVFEEILDAVYEILDPLLPCVEDREGNRAGFCGSLIPTAQPNWHNKYNKDAEDWNHKVGEVKGKWVRGHHPERCDTLEKDLYHLYHPYLPCYGDEGYCGSIVPKYRQGFRTLL
ncbi:hypothetical protein ACQY0O_008373 [Thecaphora frezii]